MTERAFSATGKAILAGGYLVLFPEYRALVVALSARMHALTHAVETNGSGNFTITVKSPQFLNGLWSYNVDIQEYITKGLNSAVSELHGKRNPFVEATIWTIIGYVIGTGLVTTESVSKKITITMFSDPEYHSQEGATEKFSKNHACRFLFHHDEITKVPKTGLGSSAGLVTSLTAALLSVFVENFNINDPVQNWKSKIHRLAQIAHCKAQGKIGSGFDVVSATFGSIIYQRFEPSIITEVLESADGSLKQLSNIVDMQEWNMTHDMCALPPGIRLLMGDVKGGSETPKMVSQLLKWRQLEPDKCGEVWFNLNQSNNNLMDGLKELSDLSLSKPNVYNQILQQFSSHKPNQIFSNPQVESDSIKKIVSAIKHIRENLQILTREANVAIEPESQTLLLNTVSDINGVFGGVVPGAGGYDAICVLVVSSEVEKIKDISLENPIFQNVRWMDLTEQKVGLIEEKASDFADLV
ncbi:hypothetical protein CANINC_004633 [Pichia inconspicua]|uniref:Phosphomevalonate kinase n=1 Tax=Pichia inconspicua TaxID=52247 RepID=A0A4T0WVT7_9ASCO|nr:hypothetical protein CANINC_004633 [[Candida] inconspicua]